MEGALVEKNNHVVALSDHELVARLAGIIDVSDDAISSSNLEGRLLSWNRGATRLYGWAAADALTTDPTLLIPAELRDFEDRILQRVLRGELVERYDSQRLRKDGSLVEDTSAASHKLRAISASSARLNRAPGSPRNG